ncbi:MAG TPA: serine/threonine-protein kinase [Pyrinomonadaceae bacterium]|nr:serine/threonine-protein kinase [Pyrinomonadaceae bacterium]
MDVPQVIANRFRVECEIGKGGMGTVYRATHLGLDRTVAVKVLKREFAADPEVAERFMREARTMARLRHPRAAIIFDAGRLPDGRPFIVMEHVEGATLAETLARDGCFAPERAVRVAAEICDVLAEAHQLGIVHRDLKPSNIMLNARGVCVLDFGIAKVLASSADTTKTCATTESGIIIGTPRYMSPEQCVGQSVGPASDLYSVGVLLYEMLTGRPPFTDELHSAVLVKQATAPPPPLVARRPDVPRPLAQAVHSLLAKNPQDRPRSARDARSLLERSLASAEEAFDLPAEPTHAPFASTLSALDSPASRAGRLFAAALVLAALGGTAYVWSQTTADTIERAGLAATARPGEAGRPMSSAKGATAGHGLTPGAARQIAASLVSRGTVTEAHAVRVVGGAAIVAVREQRQEGQTQLLLFESRGPLGGYKLSAAVALDKEDFSGANWSTDVVDADGDGYDEVICTGSDAANDSFTRRLVIYVPRTRQTYAARAGLDSREARAVRLKWSSNAGGERAAPFRRALRERALADVPRVNS